MMNNTLKYTLLLGAFLAMPALLSAQPGGKEARQRADSLLHSILTLFKVEKHGLLLETYPRNVNQQITYTASDTDINQQAVSFLWPYSAMVSSCVSLYKVSKDKKYRKLMDQQIKPGLDRYWDNLRQPYCYQSYPTFAGQHDRYYDDNDWIALDFCDYYALTKDKEYLRKAIALHQYIYSGWTDDLGGGIYWCEQKKESKNTCSNAPATVLCLKLYRLTKDKKYLEQAKQTYQWTRDNLCDPSDFVYWDNMNLKREIGYAKYTYNSGQMIQAGVLLYQETGDERYLKEAQQTAKGSHKYFLKPQPTCKGEAMFYPASAWFNVILFRGLKELYLVDKNATYIRTLIENADYAWRYTRDENGLLNNDWSGNRKDAFKSLLENSCMIELYAEISELGNIAETTNQEEPVPLGDPFILRHNKTYYAYGTHSDNGIEVYTSNDLKEWKLRGLALDKKDVWADRWFWAPEIYEIKGKFYMYYSADEHICVATSDSPLGPFKQEKQQPILASEHSIDNSLFIDDDGKSYLFFVRFNDGNNVWVMELEDDLMTAKENTMHPCIHVSQPWEEVQARVNEGPFVIKRKGLYHMTYSANHFESQRYGVGCATATNIMGQWTKYEENPILQNPGELVGAGHHALFTDKAGRLRIVYHAHRDKQNVSPRAMHIGQVNFKKVNGVERMRISKEYITPRCESSGKAQKHSKPSS